MKTLAAAPGLAISLFLCAPDLAQVQPGRVDSAKVPVPQAHDRAEYALDTPTDSDGWAVLEPGLHAAFGTTDELYLRCELPAPKGTAQAWQGTGWRGERLNAQVLIWSAEAVEQVRLTASGLTNAAGHPRDYPQVRVAGLDPGRPVPVFLLPGGGASLGAPRGRGIEQPQRQLERRQFRTVPSRHVARIDWTAKTNAPASYMPGPQRETPRPSHQTSRRQLTHSPVGS